jgi:hypothetical protein
MLINLYFYTLGTDIIDNGSSFISAMRDIDVDFPAVDAGTCVFTAFIKL